MFKVKEIAEVKAIIKNLKIELETIDILTEKSLGRVVSENILANEEIPSFNRSTVDGYATKANIVKLASFDIPVLLKNLGEVKMGKVSNLAVTDTTTVYVPTGGFLPKGSDSVVMIENTENLDAEIFINKSTRKNENVFLKGEDVKINDILIEKGTTIEPRDIGLMMALGIRKINVYRQMKVLIIAVGDEIIEPSKKPKIGEIRDINSCLILNYLKKLSVTADTTLINDDLELYQKTVTEGFKNYDLIISSGGTSVGIKDFTIDVLNKVGASILVHGISIKPGKPTVLASCGEKIFFGLPGQPLSAYIVLNTFIKDIIRSIRKSKEETITYTEKKLAENIHTGFGRTTYQIVEITGEFIRPIYTKSGMISSLAKADGYIIIDSATEGLEKNSLVKVYLLG